jgi:acyl-coenzyme A thioesterase PaaI-like protein
MTDIPELVTAVPGRFGLTAHFADDRLTLGLRRAPATLRLGAFRTSVLSYLVDAAAGIIVDDDQDVWTFTTDMSVRAWPRPAPEAVFATATVVRGGRRSSTCTAELVDENGEAVAVGAIGFARVPRRAGEPPKPSVRPADAPTIFSAPATLDRPLREEVGVEVVDAGAGIVEVEVRPELCNPAGTLQGAMVSLIAEAAAEELVGARAGRPVLVTELDLRYLAKATHGTVRSRCRPLGTDAMASVQVELVATDTGETTTLVYARAITVDAEPEMGDP